MQIALSHWTYVMQCVKLYDGKIVELMEKVSDEQYHIGLTAK